MKILVFHAHAGDPLSFLIKALTRSPYCHAAILVDSPTWREKVAVQFGIEGAGHLIIEAYWPKVRARLLTNDELSEIDVFDVPAHAAANEDQSMEWLIAQIANGVAYDVTDLFRFLPETRAVIGEAKSDAYQKHSFCSMLAFNAYRMGGTRLLSEFVHDFEVSPDKLTWSPLAVVTSKLRAA